MRCALILVVCFFAAWAYPILGEVVVSGSAWSRALSDACVLAAVLFSVRSRRVFVFIVFVRALFVVGVPFRCVYLLLRACRQKKKKTIFRCHIRNINNSYSER